MNKEFVAKLKAAASQAFDAEFRDELCNAVQVHILRGGRVGLENADNSCRCPEGCLEIIDEYMPLFPTASLVNEYYEFKVIQHSNFQNAFDEGAYPDEKFGPEMVPERALGLLYRMRFVEED